MSGGNDKYVCVCVCVFYTENENYLYGVSTSYPSTEKLEVLFYNELDDMKSECKQWVMTDTATLMTNTSV
jgi:hypothetical protein